MRFGTLTTNYSTNYYTEMDWKKKMKYVYDKEGATFGFPTTTVGMNFFYLVDT